MLFEADFRRVFGRPLEPAWTHLTRVGLYTPIFAPGYRNPPVQSSTYANLYLRRKLPHVSIDRFDGHRAR